MIDEKRRGLCEIKDGPLLGRGQGWIEAGRRCADPPDGEQIGKKAGCPRMSDRNNRAAPKLQLGQHASTTVDLTCEGFLIPMKTKTDILNTSEATEIKKHMCLM